MLSQKVQMNEFGVYSFINWEWAVNLWWKHCGPQGGAGSPLHIFRGTSRTHQGHPEGAYMPASCSRQAFLLLYWWQSSQNLDQGAQTDVTFNLSKSMGRHCSPAINPNMWMFKPCLIWVKTESKILPRTCMDINQTHFRSCLNLFFSKQLGGIGKAH